MIFSASAWWLLSLLALLPWVGPLRGKNKLQNILRSLAFILLAAAMSRPHLSSDDAMFENVVVIDTSESVDSEAISKAIQKASAAAKNSQGRTHLVMAGSNAPSTNGPFASTTQINPAAEGSSPLSGAIAYAAGLIPRTGNGSVMIASDGLGTRPDDARAISGLRSRGIPIDIVPLTSTSTSATPVALNWLGELQVGSTARLQTTIVARGGSGAGTVTLRTGDDVLATAKYNGNQRESVALEYEPSEAGFLDAEVVVDIDGKESSLPVTLAIKQPVDVVYLGNLQENASQQLSKVLGPGFKITTPDPADADSYGKALATADLVVLDDLAADTVPAEAERELVNAVANEGLGMVMSGGRSGFGSGGWHDHPVETMLPVELVQKEEKRDPSTSLVIVIDTSGSMSGVRVQLAKEVSRLAMRRLMPHDKVGIVEFFGAKRWAAPLQPASNQIELQRALNRMDAGGGTVILPALEEAFYGLQNIDTRYKHVLVLTDGGVEAGDFESLMRRMGSEGINVSTVLCGGGYHSEFLVNISNWGKGRFYNVPNRFNLPEILLKQPSTAKLPSYRPGVHNVRARGGSGWWGTVDTSSVPVLAGYVETKPRAGSEVLLETVEGNHPVLATWRYGLGRVTTLATEPVGEGTKPWRDWKDYGEALARIMERSAADTRDPFRFEIEYDGAETVLHAIRQRPRTGTQDDPVPVAKLLDESDSVELTFVARSPDRFVARTPNAPVGESLRIMAGASSTPTRIEPLVANSPVVKENSVDPGNALDLDALAQSADGRILTLDSDWSNNGEPGGKRLRPLASWLFAAALIVFLCELIWRRKPQASGL